MKAVQVIGRWERSGLRDRKWIAHHFREWLWEHGIAVRSNLSFDIRKPGSYTTDADVRKWHQDGDGRNNKRRRFWLVMWSNVKPTELRLKRSKRIFEVAPGHVVLVRNDLVEHRSPTETHEGRWFIRVTDVAFIQPS